jgi:hypothetical protein
MVPVKACADYVDAEIVPWLQDRALSAQRKIPTSVCTKSYIHWGLPSRHVANESHPGSLFPSYRFLERNSM